MSYKFGPPLMVLGKPYTRLLDRDGSKRDGDVWFERVPPELWVRNVRSASVYNRFEFTADDGQIYSGRSFHEI